MVKDLRPDNLPAAFDYPCPVCQATKFHWGTLSTVGVGVVNNFSLTGFKVGSDVMDVYSIWLRRCLNCGNLQAFSFIQ